MEGRGEKKTEGGERWESGTRRAKVEKEEGRRERRVEREERKEIGKEGREVGVDGRIEKRKAIKEGNKRDEERRDGGQYYGKEKGRKDGSR